MYYLKLETAISGEDEKNPPALGSSGERFVSTGLKAVPPFADVLYRILLSAKSLPESSIHTMYTLLRDTAIAGSSEFPTLLLRFSTLPKVIPLLSLLR